MRTNVRIGADSYVTYLPEPGLQMCRYAFVSHVHVHFLSREHYPTNHGGLLVQKGSIMRGFLLNWGYINVAVRTSRGM